MRRNVCGLISGNLKRHLESAHQIFARHLHGGPLIDSVHPDCATCRRHADALDEAMRALVTGER